MKSIVGKLAFAAALFGALIGTTKPSSAIEIETGTTFFLNIYGSLPPGTEYNHVSWTLLFSEAGPWQPGEQIMLDAYGSGGVFGPLLGFQILQQPYPFAVTNISSGFDLQFATTTDTVGYLAIMNQGPAFDWIGGSAIFDLQEVAATPLPAALPLFASGLGAIGFLAWRRKRKTALAA